MLSLPTTLVLLALAPTLTITRERERGGGESNMNMGASNKWCRCYWVSGSGSDVTTAQQQRGSVGRVKSIEVLELAIVIEFILVMGNGS